jgi:argininosuccinate synthase
MEPKQIYSIDQNLWGRSIESGPLENPETEPPDEAFEWIQPIEKTPNSPSYVKIGFENGVPTTIDEKERNPEDLISYLNKLAGNNGFGIIDHIEDRLVGIKSREVYECPAALCIIEAHKDLEKLVLTRHEISLKSLIDTNWSWLAYSGLWQEPLRKDLDAFINSTQESVYGSVKIKLYKGSMRVVGRSSKFSLYDHNLATYGISSTFDQRLSEGFIDLWGLPSRVGYKMSKIKEKDKNS